MLTEIYIPFGHNLLVDNMYKNNSKQKGFVLWFTGLSGAGKSTISDKVYEILKERGLKIERLDGDAVRENLTKDLDFSKKGRDENIRRIGFVTHLISRNNIGVVASFISPYRAQRDELRNKINNFIEIFVDAPLEVCEQRDKKGLYKKARQGKISNFTGISDPYEAPKNPEIELKTNECTAEQCASKVINYLEKNQYIG